MRPPFDGLVTFTESTRLRRKCFNITVLQDMIYENTESLMVNLEHGKGTTRVRIEPSVTEVSILDSNGKSCAVNVI